MQYRMMFDLDLTESDVQEAVEDFRRMLGVAPEVPGEDAPFEELAERDFRREFGDDEDMMRIVTNFSIRKVEDIEDPAQDASDFIHYTREYADLTSDRLEIVRAILDEAEVYVGDAAMEMLNEVFPDKDHFVWSRVLGSRG